MTKEKVLKMIQESLEEQETEEFNTLLFGVVYRKKEDNTERVALISEGSLCDIASLLYEVALGVGYEGFVSISNEISNQLLVEQPVEDDNG